MAELSTDVLVIGAGASGLATALSAHENGAKVIIAEKTDKVGGSAIKSGGDIAAPGTRFQKEKGINDDNENWLKVWHEREENSYPDHTFPDYNFVNNFMTEAVKTTEWMTDYVGIEWKDIFGIGADPFPRIHSPRSDGGQGSLGGPDLIAEIMEKVDQTRIPIYYNYDAQKLIVKDGKVVGATFKHNGKNVDIMAKNVVISSGGFAANEELMHKLIPKTQGYHNFTYSAPGNMGRGIKMAGDIGAFVYDHPWILGNGIGAHVKGTYMIAFDQSKIFVNGDGKRVAPEDQHYAMNTNSLIKQGGNTWLISDSNEHNKAMNANFDTGIESGEVVKADSIDELAKKMHVSPENLKNTVETYNESKKTGKDPMGKQPKNIVPIVDPPYYAVKIFPVVFGTVGGLKINDKFQVFDKNDKVIPGLYATGESSNRKLYNHVYMSGSSIQYALTSGRLVGKLINQ